MKLSRNPRSLPTSLWTLCVLVVAFAACQRSAYALSKNGRIAFWTSSYSDTGIYGIVSINADGTDEKVITPIGGNPSYSPDGSKIAFGSRDGSNDIKIVNVDGSGLINLTNDENAGGQQNDYPTWSPNGAKIAFASILPDQTSGIFVINADGSGRTRLTNNESQSTYTYDYSPSWSPDGTKILFSRSSDIWIMNADGSNAVALTSGYFSNYDPKWSPDGSKILFGSDRAGEFNSNPVVDLYTMNPDGSNVVRLTFNSLQIRNASYSPDGTQIVFSEEIQGSINVINADGTNVRTLFSGANSYNTYPTWARVPFAVPTASAQNDDYTFLKRSSKHWCVESPGIMVNDTYSLGAYVRLVQKPQKGYVILKRDGSFVYSASNSSVRTDSFTYSLFDNGVWSKPATVTLNITNKK